MKNKTIIRLIVAFCFVGLLASIYLIRLHFVPTSGFCDLNAQFSCSTINQSKYASFLGIPVAIIGALGYLLLISIAIASEKKKKYKKELSKILLFFSSVALIFSLYLTYIEFQVLKTLCIFCLTSQAVILIVTFFAFIYYQRKE